MLATKTGSDGRIPLIYVKSKQSFPISLLLLFSLQLKLGASGDRHLPQIITLNYTLTTQRLIPKSDYLILVIGLLIFYRFSLFLV